MAQAELEAEFNALLDFLDGSHLSASAKEFFQESLFTINSLIWLYNGCQPPIYGESPVATERDFISKSFDIPYKWRGMLVKAVEEEGATHQHLEVFARLLGGMRRIERIIFPHGVPHSAEQLEQLRAQQGALREL